MKTVLLLICLIWPIFVSAADNYENGYCKDPAELQKWADMVDRDPDSDGLAAIHALWIGLCAKVEAHNITTTRANKIFEEFRTALLESMKKEGEQTKKDETQPSLVAFCPNYVYY